MYFTTPIFQSHNIKFVNIFTFETLVFFTNFVQTHNYTYTQTFIYLFYTNIYILTNLNCVV